MSCKPCTYSPVMEEDSSLTSSLDTRQLSLLSGMDTPAKSSENAQQMDGSPACKCGKEMSDCLIHPSTPEKWTASMQDSLARILALPENRQGLARKRAAASTVKSSASLAWFDPVSCSWKTSQQSFLTDSEQSWQTLPRSGMTLNGYAFALPIVGRITTGTDGGCWPTPDAGVMNLNTPIEVNEARRARAKEKHGNGNGAGLTIAAAVRMFPKPTAHNAKECAAPAEYTLNTPTLAAVAGGILNPAWVEWLMGFPIGFTVSKDWATRKSPYKQQSRGNSSEGHE